MGLLSRHPNIVTVLASGFTSDYRPCIVMDLYELGNYMQYLRDGGPLGLEELLPLGVQIAGALATAHQHGVIHGDVKPQNIFRSEFGYSALGDFGISTFRDRPADRQNVWLSPHYAAPELLEGASGETAAPSDQYSLAATVHTLATGQRPFDALGRQTKGRMLLRAQSGPPPRLPRTFPDGLADALQRAMAPDPEARFADLVEFAVALNRIEAGLGHNQTSIPVPRKQPGTAGVPNVGDRRFDDETTVAIPPGGLPPEQPPLGYESEPQPSDDQDGQSGTWRKRGWLIALAIGAVLATVLPLWLLDSEGPGVVDGKTSSSTGKPSSSTGKPSSSTGKPSSSTGKPSSSTGKPSSSTGKTSSTTGKTSSTTGKTSSTTGKTSSTTGKTSSTTGKTSSTTGKTSSIPPRRLRRPLLRRPLRRRPLRLRPLRLRRRVRGSMACRPGPTIRALWRATRRLSVGGSTTTRRRHRLMASTSQCPLGPSIRVVCGVTTRLLVGEANSARGWLRRMGRLWLCPPGGRIRVDCRVMRALCVGEANSTSD